LNVYKSIIFIILLLFSLDCSRKSNFEKAMEYYTSMKTTQALLLLKNSNVPREIYLEGDIYLRLNDPRSAIKAFDRLIEIDPGWSPKVLSELEEAADKAIARGMGFTAKLMLEKILEYDPEFELGIRNFFLGDWYFDSREYDRAIDFYESGIEYDSLNLNARFKMAQCYLYEDELLSAYQNLKKGVETHKHWKFKYWLGKVSYTLAKKRFDEGNYSSAELYLAQIISLGIPKVLLDDAYFLLGDIRLGQEKYKEAESCYEKVLLINQFAKPKIVKDAEERLKIVKSMEESS